MMQVYNYTRRDEAFNDIIDEAVAFAADYIEGKTVENKKERLENLNEALVKYAVTGTRFEGQYAAEGRDIIKNPMCNKNEAVRENFDAIIAQVINPILPMVSNKDFERFLVETRQIGWGETARFIVKSNELYKVNEIAEGVARGALQPIFNNEITVNTTSYTIAAGVDFYHIAAGVFDLADFAMLAARSFEQFTFVKIVGEMTSAITAMGSAYTASGYSTDNWTEIARKVSVANGGSEVFAMGSLKALGKVIPSTANLQIGLGQKIADQGFLDRYLGVRLVCLDQAFATPWAIDTNAKFALADNIIYFVPVSADKPVKIVYEGNTIEVEKAPGATPDHTYIVSITIHMGIAAVVGSKYGCINQIA